MTMGELQTIIIVLAIYIVMITTVIKYCIIFLYSDVNLSVIPLYADHLLRSGVSTVFGEFCPVFSEHFLLWLIT